MLYSILFYPVHSFRYLMSKNRPVQLPNRVSAMIFFSSFLFILHSSLLSSISVWSAAVCYCLLLSVVSAVSIASVWLACLECLLVDWLWRISDDPHVSLTGGRFTTKQIFKYSLRSFSFLEVDCFLFWLCSVRVIDPLFCVIRVVVVYEI